MQSIKQVEKLSIAVLLIDIISENQISDHLLKTQEFISAYNLLELLSEW